MTIPPRKTATAIVTTPAAMMLPVLQSRGIPSAGPLPLRPRPGGVAPPDLVRVGSGVPRLSTIYAYCPVGLVETDRKTRQNHPAGSASSKQSDC